jgi:hypothetical protein
MNKFNFQYSGGLIIVTVIIPGIISGSPFEYVLALDTGSTKTILQPSSILQLGYSENDKTKNVGITTGTKTEKGYEIGIEQLHCLGCKWNKPTIIVKQLPLSLYYIDGLLGLDFFQSINKKLTIDFEKAEIQIQ